MPSPDAPHTRGDWRLWRGQPELANTRMDHWAAYLRGQADALGLPVIDTSIDGQPGERPAREHRPASVTFVLDETRRLGATYPAVLVAPLLYRVEDDRLLQIVAN